MVYQRDAESRFLVNIINLEPIAADPTDVKDGDLWINSTTNLLKVRINGVTKTVTLT